MIEKFYAAHLKNMIDAAAVNVRRPAADAASSKRVVAKGAAPRASARYDHKLRQIVVKYTNGAIFSFPPALIHGLSGAPADKLADVRILGRGFGLHWEALDTDLTDCSWSYRLCVWRP